MRLLILALLVSCQPIEEPDTTEQRTAPQIGTSPWDEADLSNEDKSLARTICQALQDKVSIMKRDFLNRGLNFSVDKRNGGLPTRDLIAKRRKYAWNRWIQDKLSPFSL